MKKTAIIVAGGTGSRMKSNIPKQFLIVQHYPLLYHTLRIFSTFEEYIEIILVLPEQHIEIWKSMCEKFKILIPHNIVAGGPTRYHSVKSGLKACAEQVTGTIVAIHDGVRPFISHSLLKEGFSVAELKGSAIPVIPVKESLREVHGAYSQIVPRNLYHIVQTPQFFNLNLILDAYRIPYSETFTDDASVFEASGRDISIIQGNDENIKITSPVDLLIAERILSLGFIF